MSDGEWKITSQHGIVSQPDYDPWAAIVPELHISVPKGKTNGDMIKDVFPDYDVEIEGEYVTCWIDEHKWIGFTKEWWDTPYRRHNNV